MKKIFLDVLTIDGRFICQVLYCYCPAFRLDYKDVYSAVIARRPSLRDKDIIIQPSTQRVHR